MISDPPQRLSNFTAVCPSVAQSRFRWKRKPRVECWQYVDKQGPPGNRVRSLFRVPRNPAHVSRIRLARLLSTTTIGSFSDANIMFSLAIVLLLDPSNYAITSVTG